jgi:hypothetical protein
MPGLDTRRTDLLLQFILAKAAESDDWRDRELGPIHVLKYCYLADLAFAERNHGRPFTGAAWQFYHFGPWQAAIHERIEPALVAAGAMVKRIPARYEGDFVRFALGGDAAPRILDAADHELPTGVIGAIAAAIREHGADTASLLRHVYLTRPMLNAAPGEILDLKPSTETEPTPIQDQHSVGKRQQRLRSHAAAALRLEYQERRRKPATNSPTPAPPPRYDDIFQAGTEWLDSLAGKTVSPLQGEVTIGESVWKSEQRGERDVP